MIALADAVIPIIRLLVAVATRSGTPIRTCMTGTLTSPPPIPSRADVTPANDAAHRSEAQVPDAVARARERGDERAVRGDIGRRSRRLAAGSVDALGLRVSTADHRDGDVDEERGEQAARGCSPEG